MSTPQIVNVRGTSGSGKTTLIKRVMSYCEEITPVNVAGRKQPLGYVMHYKSVEGRQSLFIPGHYASPCGGCDTLGKYLPGIVEPRLFEEGEEPNSYHLIFGLVRKYWAQGYNVLFEGLLISGDVRHTKALHDDKLPVTIVAFDLPVEECIQSVINRRKAAGNDKPFNEYNTREKHRLLGRCMQKLSAAGLTVLTGDRGAVDLYVARVLEIVKQ